MTDQFIAWAVVILGFLLPLAHIVLSPSAGAWRAPADSRCPFGPRMGWVVMILLMGPIGWFLFMVSRKQKKSEPK